METMNHQEEDYHYTDEKFKTFIEKMLINLDPRGKEEGYDHLETDKHTYSNYQEDNYQLSQLALEAIDGFLFVMSKSGVMLFVSPRIESVLKCNKMDVMGGNLFSYAHHEDVMHLKNQFQNHTTRCPITSDSSSISGAIKPQYFCSHCSKQKISFSIRIPEDVNNTVFYKLQCSGFIHCTQLAADKSQFSNQHNNQYGENYSLSICSQSISPLGLPFALSNSLSTSNGVESVRDIWLTGVARLASKRKTPRLRILPQGNARLLCDINGIVQQIDQRFTDITGYAFQEMIGQSIFNYVHEKDVSILNDAHKSAINEGHCSNVLYRLLIKGGDCIWLKANIGVSRQPNGKIDYLITDNMAIRKSENKCQLTTETAYQTDINQSNDKVVNTCTTVPDPLSSTGLKTVNTSSSSPCDDIQYQSSPLKTPLSSSDNLMELTANIDQDIAFSHASTQHSTVLTATTSSNCPVSQSTIDTFDINSISTPAPVDNATFGSAVAALPNEEPTMVQLHDMVASVVNDDIPVDRAYSNASYGDYMDLFCPSTTRSYTSAPLVTPVNTLSMEESNFHYGHNYSVLPSFTQFASAIENNGKNYNSSYIHPRDTMDLPYNLSDVSAAINARTFTHNQMMNNIGTSSLKQIPNKPIPIKPIAATVGKHNKIQSNKRKSTESRRNINTKRQCKIQAKAGNITLLLNELHKKRRLSEADRQKLMQKMVMTRWLKSQIEYQRQKPKEGPTELEKLLRSYPKRSAPVDNAGMNKAVNNNSSTIESDKVKIVANRIRRFSEPDHHCNDLLYDWSSLDDGRKDLYPTINAHSFDDMSINRYVEENYPLYDAISSPSKSSNTSGTSQNHQSPSPSSNNA